MNIPHHLRIFFFKSHVRAYTTKHGVFVAAHEDKRQKRAVPGHKRVENQDGTDLFSAPAAPVADKAKKPTTRDLGKSRLDAFIKKHHGLPNLAHHIGQMTDAEKQRIYTEMGKLGNKTPTEVSLMFRGVKPVSAVQEDLFGAGKEKVVKETLLQLAENLASKTSTRERFRSSFDYYFRESEFSDEQRLEVLGILGLKKGGSRADYMAALDKFWSARATPRKARADGDKKEAKEARERWIIAQLNALIEDAIGHPLKNPLVAMPSEERPPPQTSAIPPSNSGSDGKPPGKPPVATGGEEDKDDFLKAPDGSIDFGEITAEQAKAIKRQAGKIRLQQGDDSYGARHIELRHGKDIRAMGFKSIAEFVSAIAKNIDQVWKPSATAQLVAVRNAGNDRVMFVELQQGTNNAGDYYTVRSAFPARAGFVKNKKWELLWEGRAQPSSDSGSSVPFAVPLPSISGDAATIPSGQSSHSSVGDKTGKIKAPSVAKNQPAAWEEDDEESQPVIPTESKAALFLMKEHLGAGWKKSEFPGDTVRKVIAKLIKLGLLDNSNKILTVTRAGRNYVDKYHLVIGRPLAKSLPPRYLFLKSLSRPAPIKAAPAKPTAQAKAPAAYGHHNVDEGDALHFAAGSFKGKGKVKSVGESGAVLEDDAGRDHNVHWHEITGRHSTNHKPEPARSAAP